MYSAIVADDEERIRRGITRFLETDESVQVVASAEDGLEAYEKAMELLPDMIFVDINMPHMDGLELIERLNTLEKEILVIVVSGYSDFSYAQKALRLGVFDYFLKPIMEDPFFALLDKAKKFIDEQKSLNIMQEQLKDTVEFAAERCLSLFAKGLVGLEECEKRLGFLPSSLDFPADLIVFYGKIQPGDREIDDESLSFYPRDIRTAADRVMPPDHICFISQEGQVVYLLPHKKGESPDFGQLINHFPVKMGMRTVGDPAGLCRGYGELLEEVRREVRYSRKVRTALDYIRENYADPGLSVPLVSEAAHVSPGHLGRLFRQELYRSPMDFLNGYRIEKSMEMLSRHDWKIYEVAEKSGFTSQHYFSNAFKKYVGQSPAAYRKMQEDLC